MKYRAFLLILMSLLTLLSTKAKAETETDDPQLKLDLGGMLRLVYNSSSWKDAQQARGGDFAIDCFGITAKASYDKLYLDFDYRFNSIDFGGYFLRYGYFGYDFNQSSNLKLGLVPIPFGNADFNSNSFFFSLNYYYGLEADNDMGIAYTKKLDNWQFDMAFMKNAEDLNMSDKGDETYSRYAYDVASISDDEGNMIYRNKEINQLNARAIYAFGNGKLKSRLGASVMYGALLNLDTEKLGSRSAWALHYDADLGRFNFKAEMLQFKYAAQNPEGQDNRVTAMAAYGSAYLVASEATNYTVSLSYCLPIKSQLVNSITVYNDFGIANKKESSFSNSLMNVTGMVISAGPIYMYMDWAMGKNQAWFGNDWENALAQGSTNASWNYRFNINLGFYF